MPELPAFINKDDIKRRLPLAYVCFRLGIILTGEGKASCPFHHPDNDPSFHLWVGDDGIERWSCHPCNVTGDVFDLLQRHRGIGFTDAVEMAAGLLSDLPENYVAPIQVLASRLTPDDWALEVQEAQQRAYDPRNAGNMSSYHGLEDSHDQEACVLMDEFLRVEWGWGLDPNNAIAMPHWTPEGVLTGCKLRGIDGFRWSKEGSKYDALYGGWLGKPHRAVLLTAGETDCVWAAWAARRNGVEVDVRGLPRGETARVLPEQINQLVGYATIYLGLDPDDTGVTATRMWLQALTDAGFTDVRICRLPLGRDLRDARPDLHRLLASALSPLAEPTRIAAMPGGYGITDTSKGEANTRIVSTWTLEPKAQLSGGDDGPGLDIEIRSRGAATRDVIRWDNLTSIQQLKKWAAARGLIFSGTDRDLTAVAEHIQWRASFVPEVFQTDRVGLHEPPEAYRWSRRSVVFPKGYIGDLPWVYAPGLKKADVRDSILLPTDEGAFDWRWLAGFLALSDASVMQPLLAWACAAARRPDVTNFPLMFVGGPSGVGKSTLAKLTARLIGSRIEAPLGSVTPYILMQRLASSTTLPVFVDEWTRQSRRDTREGMQGLVPVVYEGGLAERGQSDLTNVRYRVTAPVIMAGEDVLALDRELERFVRVFPKHGWQSKEALSYVGDKPLERFGRLLHEHIVTTELAPLVDRIHPTRPAHNEAVLRGGWATLHSLLDRARLYDPNLPDIPLELTMPDTAEYEADENVYEMAVRESVTFRDTAGLPVVWEDTKTPSRGTFVRFTPLLTVVERNLDLELPGRGRAMMDYFRGKFGLQEYRVRPPGAATVPIRAYLINGFDLNPNGIEVEEDSAADQVADMRGVDMQAPVA